VRLAVLLVVFLTAFVAFAQVVTVTIQGRGGRHHGAAISQAKRSVTNPSDWMSPALPPHRPLAHYQIPALPVGDYTVTADKSGFQSRRRESTLISR